MEKNTKNGFMNIQLFGESNDASTSQNDTNANVGGNPAPTLDYEQEYKKSQIEIEKLRNAISKTNSENAEYKRKELEKMTDDEKRAKEQKDLQDRLAALESENKTMKLEKDLLANGFTAEESEKLIKGNFAIKDIAEIIKSKVDEAVKSAKASLIKDSSSTETLGKGNASSSNKSGFALYQEQQAKKHEIGEVKFN